MKKIIISFLFLLMFVFGCKTGSVAKPIVLKIDLVSSSGSQVTGKAIFAERNGIVTLVAYMKGLKSGVHAMHIHEKPDCSAADASSTGGHWNPTFKPHGKWGTLSCHKGDIGNFKANADGQGSLSITTNQWCIGCGDPAYDILGKGLIVHQGADDYVSQPSGNSGSRVACSAIIQ